MSSVENDGHLAAQLKNNDLLTRILDACSQAAWLAAVHAPITDDETRRAACAEVRAVLTITQRISDAITAAEANSRKRGGVA